MDQKELVMAVITDIAQGLQEFVYNRQEGDKNDPAESIVCASYTQVNDLLVTTVKKFAAITSQPMEAADSSAIPPKKTRSRKKKVPEENNK